MMIEHSEKHVRELDGIETSNKILANAMRTRGLLKNANPERPTATNHW